MSSLKSVLFFLLVQISKCYFLGEYSKNFPFFDYYVTSTNLLNFHNASEIKKNIINDRLSFKVKFDDNIVLKITVRLKNRCEVVDSKTNFSVYGKNSEDYIDIKEEIFELVEGFVISNQNASSVIGYIKNNYFYGTIFYGKCIYYIEDLNNYVETFKNYRYSENNAVIYKENTVNLPFPQNFDEEQPSLFHDRLDTIVQKNEKELYKSIIGNGTVCTLLVLVDSAFLKIHNNNIKSAISQILTSLEEANSLFRSTDFDDDGYPDNIGLLVKHFIVLQSEISPMNVFPKDRNSLIDSGKYLNSFSEYELLREVCLGLAFTGYTFQNDILGVSYTAKATEGDFLKFSVGGICERPYKYQTGGNFNTIVISLRLKNGNILPQHILDLTVAHELGHSFGSSHDISAPCRDHLMTAITPKKILRQHFKFSTCSKKMILRTIISKGNCFENFEGSFCGNGIIEQEEHCDCGTIRDCQDLDICCTPRGQLHSCKVNKKFGHQCHPSQGMCCNSECKYKDLSKFDLECRNFEKTCPCEENTKSCTCGINGRCTGNICSSEECTRISLLECGCPTNITYNKCKICCSYNNSCLPASLLTGMLIESNTSLATHLKLLQNRKKEEVRHKFTKFYKKFYFENGSLELHFREVNVTGYCILFGKLGKCNKYFNCIPPKFKQIYPTLSSVKKLPVINNLLLSTISLLFSLWNIFHHRNFK